MSDEETSKLYWLLPILFDWIGGLTGWLVLNDKNQEKANNVLIAGIVIMGLKFLTVVIWLFGFLGI